MSTNKSVKKRAPKKPASSKANPEQAAPKHPVVKENIQAPYSFNEDEIAHMNTELREQLAKAEELTAQKKESAQDFKLRIDSTQNRVKQLCAKLTSGQETRQLEAHVEFDAPRRQKRYLHPTTGEFIREEPMTPADWQLPMFKPAADGSEQVADKGATDAPVKGAVKPAKEPAHNDPGQTNVGNVLDSVAALTDAPKLNLKLEDAPNHTAIVKRFRQAANDAQWTEPQKSLMLDRLRECETEEAMVETLKAHIAESGEGTEAQS